MADEETKPRRPWWRTALRWTGELLLYFVIAVVVVSLIRAFLIQNYIVPSGSMENTLQIDDMILAWKPGGPERGDIVVFRDDLDWLAPVNEETPAWKEFLAWIRLIPPTDEQYLVKRVIGLEGDHITCCDASGRITVNGVALDEPYLIYYNAEAAQRPFDVVVPKGRMFMMGDHRDGSKDSRAMLCSTGSLSIAAPSIDSVQGSVFAIVRPLSRFQTVSTSQAFSDVPDPTGSPPTVEAAQWSCP